ncbi:hypothetical protein QM013_33855 [Pseudomonas aeruginosa]|uniref:hypothetical protein n=1 Tax=Pseudomonas aeruginosa TaxID=287 RepID=UPI002874523E|nr:hypothetical protein [Pseudomonas aeruginosa]MDS1045127.1 hypothetical protein [Pseudomonas aeruginosa]
MSLHNVLLKYVSIANLYGKAFDGDVGDEAPTFKARFGLTLDTDKLNEENENSFEISLSFETFFANDESFFKIEIVGHFSITGEVSATEDWLKTPEAANILGTSLYPYLRNLSKPLLEGLGAGDVDFPWGAPPFIDPKAKKERRKAVRKS